MAESYTNLEQQEQTLLEVAKLCRPQLVYIPDCYLIHRWQFPINHEKSILPTDFILVKRV
jgi:hypothetical protein